MVRRISLVLALCLTLVGAAAAAFNPCAFNFGTDWSNSYKSYKDGTGKNPKVSPLTCKPPAGLDYVTVWLTQRTVNGAEQMTFNPYEDGIMLAHCQAKGLTPVFVSYIIAKLAWVDAKLCDCNENKAGSQGTLCSGGASYIQSHRQKILDTYKQYATDMLGSDNVTAPLNAIWLMEPDYYQYVQHGLSASYAASLMSDIIKTVKSVQPEARFSIDISPWADQSSWYKNFDLTLFSFAHTSGGGTDGGSDVIRGANPGTTWSGVHSATGKLILADVGYGTSGGADQANVSSWTSASNLTNRMKSGVIAVTRQYADDSWYSSTNNAKSTVNNATTTCVGGGFSLTLNAGAGGSISASPSATSYESGATVQLTAVPQAGYQFDSWSGDVTGTSASTSIKITKNSTVTASFKAGSASKFTLTVLPTTGGTITLEPNQASYDSMALVKVTAVPAAGYTFTIWKDAVVTKVNPNQILMNKNKSIGATFTSNTAVLPRLNTVALQVIQTRDGVSVRIPVQKGTLQAEVVGMDGSTETVLQSTTVQTGTFDASYSLAGLRPGLHLIRVTNGQTEYRAVVTNVVR